jgi:hypothetical protein
MSVMTKNNTRLAAATLAVVALGTAGVAWAKDAEGQRQATAFRAVLDCRGLADNTARLACFDAATAKMGEAETRGDIVVIDRAQASAAHREAFGLHVPSLGFVVRALKPEEVDSLDGVVRAARADINGHWTLILEDGARWRQISGDLMRAPRAGSKVRIHKGSLGSFLMNVDGQTTIKVHRDE